METNHVQGMLQWVEGAKLAHAGALEANGITEDMIREKDPRIVSTPRAAPRTATNTETSAEDTRDMESRQHVVGNGADPTNGVTPATLAEIAPDPELDGSVSSETYERLVHYMNKRYAIVIDNQLGSKPVILGFPRNIG